MTEPAPHPPLPTSDASAEREVQRGIRTMRLALTAQTAFYLAAAVITWSVIIDADDVGAVVWPAALVSVNTALMVALAVCGIRLGRRERQVAFAILWLESAFMAILLIGFLVTLIRDSASGLAPVGLLLWGGLVLVVLRPLRKPELRAAFDLPPLQPRR